MPQKKKRSTDRNSKHLLVEALESKILLHAAGVLSGTVYLDANSSGARDALEPGVPGVVVRLAPANSSDPATERSTITDDHGKYTFDGLEAGTYQITKRPTPISVSDQDSALPTGVASGGNLLSDVVLEDDQNLGTNDFREPNLRPEYIRIAWFFASTADLQHMLRETIALGESLAGNLALAATIRAGRSDVPQDQNSTPQANDDVFSVDQDEVLNVNAQFGVLANDTDPAAGTLSANLVGQPTRGSVTLNADGSFSYTPETGFSGSDSFTYQASNGTVTSNVATVRIQVAAVGTPGPFLTPVPTGPFDAPDLLGIRTDLVPGAPAITSDHVDGDIDYTGYSNPPTYGDHHGSDSLGTDSNPGITPRPTGIYTTEQPDEDMVHNLEHGHVWISYQPDLISASDRAALEQLLRDGAADPNGGGAGVILTPRAANDAMITLASWAHLLTLDRFDAATIREFINTNRGHAPEGFITP